ncbi:MAG: septum formation initiator family protein [Candidatus Sungbacteria bacterium]|nr:septum formation initiator family protein [Candidatus Sungbacteria bacterium]
MGKRAIWSITAIIILGALIISGGRLVQVWRAYSQLKANADKLEKKLADYELENRELRDQLRIAETPEAIERDSKSRLNMKKPGEKVVIVVPPQVPSSTAPAATEGLVERLGQFFRSLISPWR